MKIHRAVRALLSMYSFKNEAFNNWYLKYVLNKIINNNGHIFYNDKSDYVEMKYTFEKFYISFSNYKDIFEEVEYYDMDMINGISKSLFKFEYAQENDVYEFVTIAFENGFF